jgi:hypothetical protein
MARPAQEGTVASKGKMRASSRISLLLGVRESAHMHGDGHTSTRSARTAARCMLPANAHCVKLSV